MDGAATCSFIRSKRAGGIGRGRPLPTLTALFRRHNPTWRRTSPKIPTTSIFSRSAMMPTSVILSAGCSITSAQFLLELGVGSAFVGSQYRLTVGNEEFYIDLLF